PRASDTPKGAPQKKWRSGMTHLTRRSILRGSLAVAAAGTATSAAPRIARAAATTASVWFTQGFVQDEDTSLRKTVADYEKQRGTYGVPLRAAVVPCHIWKSLVEKAGMKIEDVPKTWDAYFDFFKKVQDALRKQGERKVYGLGFQVTANGVDPYNLFMAFLV